MKRKYLGDSYDAVKRLWHHIFDAWAPVFAEPRFIPNELRTDFTRMTRIRIMGPNCPTAYSILNDPDTGIRLPSRPNQTESRSHISIKTILKQLEDRRVRCVITFDQSQHRIRGFSGQEQRKAKMKALAEADAHAFYYVSHAPFLFAFPNVGFMQEATELIARAGIPKDRLEGV